MVWAVHRSLCRNFHPCILDCATDSCIAVSVDPVKYPIISQTQTWWTRLLRCRSACLESVAHWLQKHYGYSCFRHKLNAFLKIFVSIFLAHHTLTLFCATGHLLVETIKLCIIVETLLTIAAVSFVRLISAIVITITDLKCWDTMTDDGTMKLVVTTWAYTDTFQTLARLLARLSCCWVDRLVYSRKRRKQ